MIVHTAEALGFTLTESFQMLDAVVDIHAEFNAVNDTTAAVTTQTLSSVPFTYQSWVFDAVPTIHVGFTSDPNAAIGSTDWRVDQGNCTILEAHIAFQDANLIPWLLQEPTEEGYDYWDVEHNINTMWWFRIAYMHELLHAFGAAHSNNSYSYLNYSDRPFANRIAGHRVMPLPDDMEYLRDYYPSNGTQYEVAVLTTWYTPTAAGGSYPAANQYRLCQPSTGVAWGSTTTEGACATLSSYDVCPGDTILHALRGGELRHVPGRPDGAFVDVARQRVRRRHPGHAGARVQRGCQRLVPPGPLVHRADRRRLRHGLLHDHPRQRDLERGQRGRQHPDARHAPRQAPGAVLSRAVVAALVQRRSFGWAPSTRFRPKQTR